MNRKEGVVGERCVVYNGRDHFDELVGEGNRRNMDVTRECILVDDENVEECVEVNNEVVKEHEELRDTSRLSGEEKMEQSVYGECVLRVISRGEYRSVCV